jgi:N-acyl-D-amino-acid deacylase
MPASTTFDLIIRGGDVIDGSGAPARVADVGVRAGRIEAVGDLRSAAAAEECDARGRIVAPGFVDVHTHSDLACFLDSGSEAVRLASVRQGVTTEIVGNCGWTPFPAVPERRQQIRDHVASVFGPAARTFDSLAEYREELSAQSLPVNLAPLVGHGTIRAAVLGLLQVRADAPAAAQMRRLLEQALDEGAFGLSSGLVYPPGVYSDPDELVDLGGIVAARGRVYTTHMRNEMDRGIEAVDEAIGVAQHTGVRTQLSHLKVAGKEQWGTVDRILARISRARAGGLDVVGDAYPYTAASTLLRALLPPWVNAGGVEHMLERLADRAIRDRIAREYETGIPGWQNFVAASGWDGIVIASAAGRPDLEGRSLSDLARESGLTPAELASRLIIECRGEIVVILHMMAGVDVETLLDDSGVLIGSDAIPLPGAAHPRNAGTFARVLAREVRARGRADLPGLVHRMAAVPAERFGLRQRGRLEAGWVADVVVLDAERVRDRADYTASLLTPEGVGDVIVSGVAVIRGGDATGARPGRVLEPA